MTSHENISAANTTEPTENIPTPMADFAHECLTRFGHLQDAQNQSLNKNKSKNNWRDNRNDWMRAIIHETVELENHVGWAWWKNHNGSHERNLKPAFMEIVDIFHFWLSTMLQNNTSIPTNPAEMLNEENLRKHMDRLQAQAIKRNRDLGETDANKDRNDTINNLADMLIAVCAVEKIEPTAKDDTNKMIAIGAVILEITHLCGHTKEDIFNWYLGKNALNLMRQDNGYQEKTYIKIWGHENGRDLEDNDFLESLILDPDFVHTIPNYYNALAEAYHLKTGRKAILWNERTPQTTNT